MVVEGGNPVSGFERKRDFFFWRRGFGEFGRVLFVYSKLKIGLWMLFLFVGKLLGIYFWGRKLDEAQLRIFRLFGID